MLRVTNNLQEFVLHAIHNMLNSMDHAEFG
jgi:hypothetical protein